MKYTLRVTETKNKSGRYHYQVIDENGNVISERRSNRKYVACTANGTFYFGRLDLIGKGDHGKQIKWAQGWHRDEKDYRKMLPPDAENGPQEKRLEWLNAIAYLENKIS